MPLAQWHTITNANSILPHSLGGSHFQTDFFFAILIADLDSLKKVGEERVFLAILTGTPSK